MRPGPKILLVMLLLFAPIAIVSAILGHGRAGSHVLAAVVGAAAATLAASALYAVRATLGGRRPLRSADLHVRQRRRYRISGDTIAAIRAALEAAGVVIDAIRVEGNVTLVTGAHHPGHSSFGLRVEACIDGERVELAVSPRIPTTLVDYGVSAQLVDQIERELIGRTEARQIVEDPVADSVRDQAEPVREKERER